MLVRKSVAFNVGQAVAERIAHLHNMELLRETARKIDLNLVTRSEVTAEAGLSFDDKPANYVHGRHSTMS